MLGRRYEDQICSIARTLEIVGERWTLLIVRDALLGLHRFDEFQRSLGIARNVLTDRLASLVAEGILTRTPYQLNPPRYDYRLTDKGRELFTLLLPLMHWGDRHLAGPDGPPRVARHAGCGGAVREHLACESCAQTLGIDEVSVLPGPGHPDGIGMDMT